MAVRAYMYGLRMVTLLERRRGRLVTGKGCKGVIEYMYELL